MQFSFNSGVHIASMMTITCFILLFTKIVFIIIGLKTDKARLVNALCLFVFFFVLLMLDAFSNLPWIDSLEYQRAVSAITAFLAVVLFTTSLDYFIWNGVAKRGGRPGAPKILTNILKYLIYFIVLVSIANQIYGMPITTLLAAAGLLTFILGYASQQTLGNLFAGIAIQFGGKLKKGQYVSVANISGYIDEFNWRSVSITRKTTVIVPNSSLANSNVDILSQAGDIINVKFSINVSLSVNLDKVFFIANEAVREASRQLDDYYVAVDEFPSSSDCKIFIKIPAIDVDEYFLVKKHFFSSFYSKCRRENIPLGTNGVFLHEYQREAFFKEKQPQILDSQSIYEIIKKVSIFEDIDEKSLSKICSTGQLKYFALGEHVIQQNAEGDSMYIILTGDAITMEEHNDRKVQMRSLTGLDFFGLKAFLLAEPRRISVEISSLDAWLFEIKRDLFSPIMEKYPDILQKLTDILVQRETENIRKHKNIDLDEADVSIAEIFREKIKHLFKK